MAMGPETAWPRRSLRTSRVRGWAGRTAAIVASTAKVKIVATAVDPAGSTRAIRAITATATKGTGAAAMETVATRRTKGTATPTGTITMAMMRTTAREKDSPLNLES